MVSVDVKHHDYLLTYFAMRGVSRFGLAVRH